MNECYCEEECKCKVSKGAKSFRKESARDSRGYTKFRSDSAPRDKKISYRKQAKYNGNRTEKW